MSQDLFDLTPKTDTKENVKTIQVTNDTNDKNDVKTIKNTNDENDVKTTKDTNDDENDLKADISLSLTAIPEFNQYPFKKSSDKFLFMASLKAPHYRENNRAPLDLVCVVDESGSMSGDPIMLVKETVEFIINNLEPNDRFGCIGYASTTREIMPLEKMDADGKKKALNAVKSISATTSTALCAGLCHGLDVMRKRVFKNDVASVMLFTDGEATDGPKEARDIIHATMDPNFFKLATQSPLDNVLQTSISPSQQVQPLLPQVQQKVQKQQVQQVPRARQQQVQQPQQGISVSSQENDKDKDKDKDKNENDESPLPCTINTFGFGPNHKASLLQAIAEHGRGMYAFIEKPNMIADTFAECLGGLVSVVAQNIQITIESLNTTKINRCISQGYNVNVLKENEKYKVTVNDIQSEENRDIIFELKLSAIDEPKEKYPIIQFSVEYKNVVKNENETKKIVCCIDRVDGNDIGQRNYELDLQFNRITAADAMKSADVLAQQGKLDDAKKVLDNASDIINESKTSKETFSKNLVNDITAVKSKLNSRNDYDQFGGKMLKMNVQAHNMQRAVQSSNYASQEQYASKPKAAMKSKFQK